MKDQDLIAVGSYNTVDPVSLLIEYGYIYEPQFKQADVRNLIFQEYAYQTFIGLENFFGASEQTKNAFGTDVLPHNWNTNLAESATPLVNVLALQFALAKEGFYPPPGNTKNDCPITAVFGPCTERALSSFQNINNIKGENGFVGNETRNVLNKLFSSGSS